MLPLRMLGRAVPKASLKSSVSCLRSVSALSRSSPFRPTGQTLKKTSYPAFSTSAARREPAGPSDQVLSEKLKHERSLELESGERSDPSPELADFLRENEWTIEDVPGNHTTIWSKKFGDENIKVEFSINDLMDVSEEADELEEDAALVDEAFDEPAKPSAKGTKGEAAAEDSGASADRGEAEDVSALTPRYPLRLNITITKPGGQAIYIVAEAQDGTIQVDHLTHGVPDEATLETKYIGPNMTSLDPDLQAMLEQYLEERGIDARFAEYVFEYNDYKEQREYVQWLQNLHEFIDA
ncbi:hypothetical protein DV736_g1402, partial [Chaetothyriales sp. CBS 134916]